MEHEYKQGDFVIVIENDKHTGPSARIGDIFEVWNRLMDEYVGKTVKILAVYSYSRGLIRIEAPKGISQTEADKWHWVGEDGHFQVIPTPSPEELYTIF